MSWKSRIVVAAGLVATALIACGPSGEASLSLTAQPKTIDNLGQTATVTATAETAEGKPGTGTVHFSSKAGSLTTPIDVELVNGEATASFSCNVVDDRECNGSVRVTATWTTGGAELTDNANVMVRAPGTGGGSGSDGGAGDDGGVGDDGGTGGGDSGDAGADAPQLTVQADEPTIFKGVGDSTPVRATLTRADGSAIAGEVITFTTSLGQLSQADGSSPGLTVAATSDAAGKADVLFAETGAGGRANITAVAMGGVALGSTTVDVLEVNSIVHTDTVCGTTLNCTVMGIRNSGFNETAVMKFTVKDAAGKPLAGVPVTFVANNAPSGLTLAPSGTTDASGVVTTQIQSGPVVGTFTVTATAVGSVSVISPTIGVRGAKPSSHGFTLQCQTVNLAAYIDPTPPRPISVQCTVTLVDRLGNPVGRVTSVNLNSEAGAVPANIMTTGFSPSGGNTNEGKGTFTFSTVGPFPALDVAPMTADPGQFPYPRQAEPQLAAGALLRNPRDGLVTLLAYTDGEEHYYDDNANGQHDPGERFIDQGEPFVDSNDNNQWDPGESYADVDGNNAWTPPNGTWDANAKIWTISHLLFTGSTAAAGASISPTPIDVEKGHQDDFNAYMPDFNMNRLEGGATFGVGHSASKGQVTLLGQVLGQDGYGFDIEGRYLMNAAGTGPCTPAEAVCAFRTIFGAWGGGFAGQFRVSGAPLTDTTPAQSDVVTVTTQVRGVGVSVGFPGTIQ